MKGAIWIPIHRLYLYIRFYQRRVDIIDQVELCSPRQVTHLAPAWDLTSPGIDNG